MNRIPLLRAVPLSLSLGFAGASLWASPARAADPTTADCVGANETALKASSEHRLRAERAQLLVCASSSCPADIRNECLHRIDDVNAAIPTIVFEAKDGAGGDLSAVKVTMDGEVIAERLEGTALSIDPGEHTFVFETPGQPPVQKQLVIRRSEKDRREPVVLGSAPSPVPTTPASPTQPLPAAPPPESPSGLGTQKIVALVAGGIGIAGIGVGAAFGAITLSKKSTAQNECPGTCATQTGVDDWNSAKTAGNVSTAFFIVGGVGLAGAAVLWFTAKPSSTTAPTAQLGVSPGMVQLRGTW